MKSKYTIVICLSLLMAACAQPGIYTGAKFPKTKSADVFYSTGDIKRHYKVIGGLILHKYSKNILDQQAAFETKKVGGDAVIILGADTSKTGNPNRIAAEVLKYD